MVLTPLSPNVYQALPSHGRKVYRAASVQNRAIQPLGVYFQGTPSNDQAAPTGQSKPHWFIRFLKALATPFIYLWRLITGQKANATNDSTEVNLPPIRGLTTPLMRQDSATKVVNTIFPTMVTLLKTRDTDPLWKLKLTKEFNATLEKYVAPGLWVNTNVQIGEGKTDNAYEHALKRLSVRNALLELPLSLHHQPVDPNTLTQVFPEAMLKQKRHYCGSIRIELPEFNDTPDETARLYDTVLHETSHLVRGLSDGLGKYIQGYSTGGIESGFIALFSYQLGWRLFGDYLAKTGTPETTVDLNHLQHAKDFDTIRPHLPRLIQQFKAFAKQAVTEAQLQDNFEMLKMLDELPVENRRRILRMRILDECEAHLSSKKRYSPSNISNPTNGQEWRTHDLFSALSGYGFQLIARRLEGQLKLPTAKRSPLAQEAFFD